MSNHPLWCKEFEQCIVEVLEPGAEKYEPHDWEKEESQSVQPVRNLHAIFNHTAREWVYQENKETIDALLCYLQKDDINLNEMRYYINRLCNNLKYDHEFGTRHLQHVSTRSGMAYVREKRFGK